VRGLLNWRPANELTLTGEAFRSEDSVRDEERTSARIGGQYRWRGVTQTVDLERVRAERAGIETESTILGLGADRRINSRLSLGAQRDQSFGDPDSRYRPTLNQLRGNWQLNEHVDPIAEHSFRGSLSVYHYRRDQTQSEALRWGGEPATRCRRPLDQRPPPAPPGTSTAAAERSKRAGSPRHRIRTPPPLPLPTRFSAFTADFPGTGAVRDGRPGDRLGPILCPCPLGMEDQREFRGEAGSGSRFWSGSVWRIRESVVAGAAGVHARPSLDRRWLTSSSSTPPSNVTSAIG
jgi:hypothetical protein